MPLASAQDWYPVMTHCVLVASLDEGDINPKVLQLLSSEKVQVMSGVSSPEIGLPLKV